MITIVGNRIHNTVSIQQATIDLYAYRITRTYSSLHLEPNRRARLSGNLTEYVVDRFTGHEGKDTSLPYSARWYGYSPAENMFGRLENIPPIFVRPYWKREPKRWQQRKKWRTVNLCLLTAGTGGCAIGTCTNIVRFEIELTSGIRNKISNNSFRSMIELPTND